MSHNGWTNYETWAVKLWLDNSEGSANDMTEKAREVAEDYTANEKDAAAAELEKVISDYHNDMMDGSGIADAINGTVFSDLLGSALSEVNFREIAESYLGDLDDDEWKEAEA